MPIRLAALMGTAYVFLELTAHYMLGVSAGAFSIFQMLRALSAVGGG